VSPHRVASWLHRYRVERGRGFRLRDVDPAETGPLDAEDEKESRAALRRAVERTSELQERLYAQDRWALLLVFQAMDAAGKDGTIEHVFTGVNPTGCQVYSFKAPSAEELDHDFLWRTTRSLPERGRIGIFNRSYYEEVLVARVHPEVLERQRLPRRLVTARIWKERFEDIRAHELHLARNGTAVLKFFLHVSKEEQRTRFLDRLESKAKRWKFDPGDVRERARWDDYQRAYEEAIRATAAPHAPWYVVPADHKWFTRLVVSAAIVEALESMGLEFPKVGPKRERELRAARRTLRRERRS
jgi:PPK2 family polyphosphate:nucleotide phosphotransferase